MLFESIIKLIIVHLPIHGIPARKWQHLNVHYMNLIHLFTAEHSAHFSSVMCWGFEITANKTLKENTIRMLKDLLKQFVASLVIGASQSEPHTSESNGGFSYIIYYILSVVCRSVNASWPF